MNKQLYEALIKQKIREIHRNAVRDTKALNEDHPLWDAFVQPFVDQLSAAKLLGKDLLNVLSLAWDTVFTLSPKKKKEARERFKARKGAIEQEWKPLMEKADDALGNNDLAFASFMFNPSSFLVTKAAEKTYKTAGSFNKFLTDSGWQVPLVGMLPGMSNYTGPSAGEVTAKQTAEREGRSLLDRLAGLFYIESSWLEGDLIVEGEEDSELPPFEKAMSDFMKNSGIEDKFNAAGKELIDAEQERVDIIINDAVPRLQLAKARAETSDINEFVQAIESAESQGIDTGASGSGKIRAEIEASANKLIQDEEFILQLKKEKAGIKEGADEAQALPEISEQEARESAEKIAFVNAKKSVEEKSISMIDGLKQEALEAIEENEPSDADKAGIKSSKLGAEYIKIFEEAKQKIDAV
jgi:hypothetical protein